MKATNVDGIYTDDPKKNKDAKLIEHTTYMEVLTKKLNVMDKTAITLCMENEIPILVFNINESGNLLKAAEGEKIGTLVEEK